jgi:hypothetical protein
MPLLLLALLAVFSLTSHAHTTKPGQVSFSSTAFGCPGSALEISCKSETVIELVGVKWMPEGVGECSKEANGRLFGRKARKAAEGGHCPASAGVAEAKLAKECGAKQACKAAVVDLVQGSGSCKPGAVGGSDPVSQP